MTRIAAAFLLALLASGCDDLDEFRTPEGEVFRGKIAGSETEGKTPADGNGESDAGSETRSEQGSFIRHGFASHTELTMTFDPALVGTTPGTISTLDSVEGQPGHFDNTPLRPIEPLFHDPLTQYDFPGGGRVRNYIFAASFADETRSALVFVSLMKDGLIEVRLIAPRVRNAEGEWQQELFGVFRLRRVRVE